MLADILEKYLQTFPEDREGLRLLHEQIERGEDLFNRKNFTGHACGAGIVLSPDHRKVLLIHHRIFDRWLQPGGHADPEDASVYDAAKREIEEETSVKVARCLFVDAAGNPLPIEINTHYIGPNAAKNEPEHYHHDFRYVFEAANENLVHQELEVHDAKWFPLNSPEAAAIAKALQRLQKLNIA